MQSRCFSAFWQKLGGGEKGTSHQPIPPLPSGTQLVLVIEFPVTSVSACVCARFSLGGGFPSALPLACSQSRRRRRCDWLLITQISPESRGSRSHTLTHSHTHTSAHHTHPTKTHPGCARTSPSGEGASGRTESNTSTSRQKSTCTAREINTFTASTAKDGQFTRQRFPPPHFFFFSFPFFFFFLPTRGNPVSGFEHSPASPPAVGGCICPKPTSAGVPVPCRPVPARRATRQRDGGIGPLGAVPVPGLGLPVPGAGGRAQGSPARAAATSCPGRSSGRPSQSRGR